MKLVLDMERPGNYLVNFDAQEATALREAAMERFKIIFQAHGTVHDIDCRLMQTITAGESQYLRINTADTTKVANLLFEYAHETTRIIVANLHGSGPEVTTRVLADRRCNLGSMALSLFQDIDTQIRAIEFTPQAWQDFSELTPLEAEFGPIE